MAFLDETGLAKVRDWIKGKFVQTVNGQAIDASGNVDVKDYVIDFSVSGQTITFIKKDGTSGMITIQDTMPIGAIIAYGNANDLSGYLPCNGGEVSRTTYAKLFAVIGTSYGAGDGSTTFNVPLLNDGRFVQGGYTVGTKVEAGLPNINGSFTVRATIGKNLPTGAFTREGVVGGFPSDNSGSTIQEYRLNASLSNPIYGNSTTVQPPAVTFKYYIKY